MHPLIEEKLADIGCICHQHHVRRLEVVGSAARGADFDPSRSDVDFLVQFQAAGRDGWDTYFDLQQALESLLDRRVDLIEGAVRNPYLQASLESARELVFLAEEEHPAPAYAAAPQAQV